MGMVRESHEGSNQLYKGAAQSGTNQCATSKPDTHTIAELAPLHGPQSIAIDRDILGRLSSGELEALYKDVRTINDVVCGFLNRPCHQSEAQAHTLSETGELLDGLHEFLSVYEDAIIKAAKSCQPTDAREVSDRGHLLLRYESWCGESFLDIGTMAMTFAKQEAEAAASSRRAAA